MKHAIYIQSFILVFSILIIQISTINAQTQNSSNLTNANQSYISGKPGIENTTELNKLVEGNNPLTFNGSSDNSSSFVGGLNKESQSNQTGEQSTSNNQTGEQSTSNNSSNPIGELGESLSDLFK